MFQSNQKKLGQVYIHRHGMITLVFVEEITKLMFVEICRAGVQVKH